MKVVIRYPKRREVMIKGGRKLSEVLRELRLNSETVVAVQGTTLLTRDVVVGEDETIEVLSAISGGSGDRTIRPPILGHPARRSGRRAAEG